MGFDAASVRLDFPILSRTFDGKPLGLPGFGGHVAEAHVGDRGRGRLLPAATTRTRTAASTPSVKRRRSCSRGALRRSLAFFGVDRSRAIVFTRGTTESINLVAHGWGRTHVRAGDEVVAHRDGAPLEHRALAARWRRRPAPSSATSALTDDGLLDLSDLDDAADRAHEDACGHGHVERARHDHAAARAGRRGARGRRDRRRRRARRRAPAPRADLQTLDADFLAFSGHKMLGPTASGGLYATRELLDDDGSAVRRRRHDPRGVPRPLDLERRRRSSSRPARCRSRSRSGWRKLSATSQALGMDEVRAHERELTRVRDRRSSQAAGATVYRTEGRRGPGRRGELLVPRRPPARSRARC